MASGVQAVKQPSLGDLGFVRPKPSGRRRINALIVAPQKCGKTEMLCQMPGPVAIMSTDNGTRGVVEKWIKRGKEIHLKEYSAVSRARRNTKDTKLTAAEQTQYQEQWEEIQRDWDALLASKDIRSVGVDTGSEWYDISRLSQWGRSSVGRFQFGPLNQMLADMFRAALNVDKNVIVTARTKKEYTGKDDNSSWDGKTWTHAGFGDMPYCFENVIWLGRDEDGDFFLEVHGSRDNGKLYRGREDSILRASDVSFLEMAQLIHPASKEEDWEDE
jgi:hypothetical protein